MTDGFRQHVEICHNRFVVMIRHFSQIVLLTIAETPFQDEAPRKWSKKSTSVNYVRLTSITFSLAPPAMMAITKPSL